MPLHTFLFGDVPFRPTRLLSVLFRLPDIGGIIADGNFLRTLGSVL